MDDLMRELKHLGLSDKEASVYLSALELGPSSVQDICHKARVNRATTYVMIEALSARGLMSTFVKGKKRFYSAESPERLVSLIRLQQKELKEKEAELESVLPGLMALYNSEGAKPQIRYLEGVEGLQAVHESFGRLQGEFIQIVPFDEVNAVQEIQDQRADHLRQFATGNASYRALIVMKQPDVNAIPRVPNGEVRVIPWEKFPVHGEITVRENHVFLYSYKNAVLSIVIVSKEIADTIRALFNLAWEGAEGSLSRKL